MSTTEYRITDNLTGEDLGAATPAQVKAKAETGPGPIRVDRVTLEPTRRPFNQATCSLVWLVAA